MIFNGGRSGCNHILSPQVFCCHAAQDGVSRTCLEFGFSGTDEASFHLVYPCKMMHQSASVRPTESNSHIAATCVGHIHGANETPVRNARRSPRRMALVPQLIVVRTPERKSAVALVFLPSFPSMCLVVGSTPFRRGDRCNSMRTV